ncbi:NFX1-type zinc finger-containing protein 1 [Pyrenophora tritici-repentis]|nr:NFX1-type zinc finger-containing protein 1 [Pyrenophora tritici-repentis]
MNCPYAHEQDGQRKRVAESEEQQQARGNYNDFKKYLGKSYAPSDAHVMRQVWERASAILNEGDRDWIQQLPKDLAENEGKYSGLAHIKAIVLRKAKSYDQDEYIETAKAFLDVITDSSLLDCLAVDTYVDAIYIFISGSKGKRAYPFLQHLCETLVAARTDDSSSVSQKILEQALVKLSIVLYELLKRDRHARLNELLEPLVETLTNAAEIIPTEIPSPTATPVNKFLGDIHQMVARAKGRVQEEEDSDDDQPTSLPRVASSYPRDLVIPNDRHDNDKKDITDIVIFPTRDEIMSDAKEFLPSTDANQPHFITNQVERHIDTQFRLLRHDIFGEQKSALARYMHAATEDPTMLSNPRVSLGDMRVYNYSNAHVSYLLFDKRRGLDALVSFPHPPAVRKKMDAAKQAWWEESKRLEEGSLLSFIWIQDAVVEHLFLTVSHKKTRPDKEGGGLTDHGALATITTRLATQDSGTLRKLVNLSLNATQGVLLEYPNIIPATFIPILENLQDMQRLSRLPFRQWVVPDPHNDATNCKIYHDVPPPLYARSSGFKYPLGPILNDGADAINVDPLSSCNDAKLIDDIATRTGLDAGQCKALIAALNREFAFIQGPPGTGKSFVGLQIMRILLGIKDMADLGPIVVVCYTNHALDQFLEHLIKIGLTKVIRVGGQSHSEMLEGYNLRDISKEETKTRTESYETAMAYKDLEECEKEATKLLGRLHAIYRKGEWSSLDRYLFQKYPKIHDQFQEVDSEGFRSVGPHPFERWKSGSKADKKQAATANTINLANIIQKANMNVNSLNYHEKCALMKKWMNEVCFDIIASFSAVVDKATETQQRKSNIHDESDRRILQGADVIGVTTSGLAKRISLLKHVRCKVIICEEAGEVMEPHMISAMLPTIEHCIQIGDHEQLRPTINNFKDLSLESAQGLLYKLDRSQFERLSIGEKGRPSMPVAQLEVQRRMRPEVSTLIRETIYPRLSDHTSTLNLPDVMGMRKNVFWLDHRYLENDRESDIHHSKSSSNPWEVDLVHAMVRHVVRQGVYRSSDIAVLTPYTGQLQKLRSAMRGDFEIVLSDRDQEALENDGLTVNDDSPTTLQGPAQQDHRRKPLQKKQLNDLLRLATVDNFQGEEAKIIIVSLVRSNDKKKVGFLKTTNRVNVLLSRAQHGMYLIGNSETYSNVAMWQKVIEMLRAEDSIGDAIELCCPRHSDKILKVCEPDDFMRLSPEGGCMEACAERLTECGHQCQARCHSKAMHAVFRCEKPCQRRYVPCDHSCQKPTCGEDCGKCMVPTDNVALPCGHVKNNVACHRTLDLKSIHCDVVVPKEVPGCKHTVDIKCSVDVSKENFKCPSPCATILSCGHRCPGNCGRCNYKDEAGKAIAKHQEYAASILAVPSSAMSHARLALRNAPGLASIKLAARCLALLRAICFRAMSDARSSCHAKCGMKSEESPDIILSTLYRDIDINESPIVVLGCGHFWTIETLDGHVGLKDVYEIDPRTGGFISLIDNRELQAVVPKCPGGCGVPIQQHATQRYNRLINMAVIAEQSRRFIATGMQEMQELEGKIDELQDNLDGSRKKLTASLNAKAQLRGMIQHLSDHTVQNLEKTIRDRCTESANLVNTIKAFQKRSSAQFQPRNKLHDAITHSANQTASLNTVMANLSLDAPPATPKPHLDLRISLGGRLLELKVVCLTLEYKFGLTRITQGKLPTSSPQVKISGGPLAYQVFQAMSLCRKLITDCINGNLPKLAVETILYYARIAQVFGSSGIAKDGDRTKALEYRDTAKTLLDEAKKLCNDAFRDRDTLLRAVNNYRKLLDKEFYEEVSAEELKAIKQAMVTGRGGISTHSGHWYNCANGHPFAIGECGMPMQQARCPECGAPIGGQHHTAAAGVTRALDIEMG